LLPAGTFHQRDAQAALMQDRGAELYARAAELPSNKETVAKLLQWSGELGDLKAAQALLKEQKRDPRAWAYATRP